MGLVDFRRGRTIGEEPRSERRNGNRFIVGDKTDPASIGKALVELVALVVAELKRRDEKARRDPNESAPDDSPDAATVETEMGKTTKKGIK
jgi:hypothetical protein